MKFNLYKRLLKGLARKRTTAGGASNRRGYGAWSKRTRTYGKPPRRRWVDSPAPPAAWP